MENTASNAPSRERVAGLLLWGLVSCYLALHLLSVLGDPMVRVPVLDAREVMDLALAFANGSLPAEPFYRAPAYAWLLSLLLRAGVSEFNLPVIAVLLNAALHLGSAYLVGRIAGDLWRSRFAAWLASALYGTYPVALYFVADLSDATVSIFVMLAGLRCTQTLADGARAGMLRAIGAGLLLGLAILFRPQMAAVAAAAALWAIWATLRARTGTGLLGVGLLGMATPLLFMAVVNHQLGGVAIIMPWQGAHALYASNGPEANGRHFAQTREVSLSGRRDNPARLEAELIYQEETGRRPLDDLGQYQAFWNGRTLRHVLASPGQWAGLLASKLRYLVNDFEQYTNRGYAFHVQRMPWLASNPLGFGVLLVLAALGIGASRPRGRGGWLLLTAGLGLIAMLLLTLVGDRHRLPLTPLLVVAGAGVTVLLSAAVRDRIVGASLALLAAIIAFWPVPAAMRSESLPDDHFQLASAWLDLGHADLALGEAESGLVLQPERAWGRALACSAAYNRYLSSLPANRPDETLLSPAIQHCAASTNPQSRLSLAVLELHACRPANAVALFSALTGETDGELAADACRMLGHLRGPVPPACLGAIASGGVLSMILDGTLPVADAVDAERSRQLIAPAWCPGLVERPRDSAPP